MLEMKLFSNMSFEFLDILKFILLLFLYLE